MNKLWMKNNKLVVDSLKRPILCDECPCVVSVCFLDTFTDSNGVAISDHTPDQDLGDSTYSVSTAWEIQSNVCKHVTDETSPVTIDVFSSDGLLTFAATGLGGNAFGVIFRHSDDSNYWFIRIGLGDVSLWKMEAGTPTIVDVEVTATPVEVFVTLSGDDILVNIVWSTGSASLSTTNSFNNDATKIGFTGIVVASGFPVGGTIDDLSFCP